MTNIWGFLLQTISVLVVAGVILIVKWLFKDKLSPRWQYGIWSLLVLCMFLPARISKWTMSIAGYWLELLKTKVELGLDSAYSQVYEAVAVKHVIPFIKAFPKSVTDWLFLVYIAGVIGFLVWYIVSYCRIRSLLRKGQPVSEMAQKQIQEVCECYHLKACRAVVVEGLPTAFVCGVFSPILAVPLGEELDEKILLHELMHLKYKDSLQSIGWCILRSLHWCNPLLQKLFDRIGNDMESLCDQRVLEQLEGEELRDYGMILLNMANEKYARMPGTTSISNGGKNIAQRIEAIVRFKKYPKGMALVSVCIFIVLGCAIIRGNTNAYAMNKFQPQDERELHEAMAMTRSNRCTTLAGALDTYAKGILYENGICIAMASSLDKQEELAEEMFGHLTDDEEGNLYDLDSGVELEHINREKGYMLLNIKKKTNGSFDACLGFYVSNYKRYDENDLLNGDKRIFDHDDMVLIPVNVRYEDGWIVEETGTRSVAPYDSLKFPICYSLPKIEERTIQAKTGELTISHSLIYRTSYGQNTYMEMLLGNQGNAEGVSMANADAELSYAKVITTTKYSHDSSTGEPEEAVGLEVGILDYADEEIEFKGHPGTTEGGSFGEYLSNWNSSLEYYYDEQHHSVESENHMEYYNIGYDLPKFPKNYQIQIYWDWSLVETVTIDEETR